MPARFIGTYYRSLDLKGRLLLPPRFLETLRLEVGEAPSFWLTMLYGRITAYKPAAWENILSQLCSIRLPSHNLANFKTRLVGMAQEIAPDAQGRVRIPQSLLRAGALKKDIVLVGIVDKFEIWDQTAFEAVPTEDVSAELAASGIEMAL